MVTISINLWGLIALFAVGLGGLVVGYFVGKDDERTENRKSPIVHDMVNPT